MKITSTILLPSLALAASAVVATAQDNNPNQGRRDRGNFNPEEFRARMEERMKTSLKVSDEEWKALQPLIEKVTTKQRDAMSSRFGGFGFGRGGGPGGDRGPGGGGGDRGPGGGDRSDRPGAAQSEALRTALENESTATDELKAKLAAVREYRKKAAAELADARAELQKVVTVRQEAVLVSMGILE